MPWEWRVIKDCYESIPAALYQPNACTMTDSLSLLIVGTYMDCIQFCGDGDLNDGYTFLDHLIQRLPVNLELVFRIVVYFCYSVAPVLLIHIIGGRSRRGCGHQESYPLPISASPLG